MDICIEICATLLHKQTNVSLAISSGMPKLCPYLECGPNFTCNKVPTYIWYRNISISNLATESFMISFDVRKTCDFSLGLCCGIAMVHTMAVSFHMINVLILDV